MILYEKALEIVRGQEYTAQVETVLLKDALGRFLATELCAAHDSPPFSKAAMDGYAISEGNRERRYTVLEVIAAGDVPRFELSPGQCSKIMTGAMVPEGTAKIIRVEYSREIDGVMEQTADEPNNNVIGRGENIRTGDILLTPRKIRPQDIGILASQGYESIDVERKPRIGIIATGSELKEPGEQLAPGEIFNSNAHQIAAQIKASGGVPVNYGITVDDPRELAAAISLGIDECDILLLTGGVSKGDYDYIPDLLSREGVEILFHGVGIKPGKPTLFGKKGSVFVFGLPGNPVSTFMIFNIFVVELLYKMAGIEYHPTMIRGRLEKEISRFDGSRTEFYPVRIRNGSIEPLNYHGSSHLNALEAADGVFEIGKGIKLIEAGELIHVRLL